MNEGESLPRVLCVVVNVAGRAVCDCVSAMYGRRVAGRTALNS